MPDKNLIVLLCYSLCITYIRVGLFSSLIRERVLLCKKGNFRLLMGFVKGETHVIPFAFNFSQLLFRPDVWEKSHVYDNTDRLEWIFICFFWNFRSHLHFKSKQLKGFSCSKNIKQIRSCLGLFQMSICFYLCYITGS